jgi:hypothetical protein
MQLMYNSSNVHLGKLLIVNVCWKLAKYRMIGKYQ